MATSNNHPVHAPTPLWAVLTLTFLGSLGTGAVTNGFSFIATEGLGYGRRMNLLLALVLGGSYIGGALASGSIVRAIGKKSTALPPRRLLSVVLGAIGLVCFLPLAAQHFFPAQIEMALWILILVFSPMTGVLWPVVEGYLSGGRRAEALRSAIGQFNIVWSGALVVAFWGMAPLLASAPFVILAILGLAHFLMIGILRWFPEYPPKHIDHDAQPVPEVYTQLLTLFRVLLIASYIVLSTLSPLLPIVETKLGIAVHWQTPIASAWLTTRVVMFIWLERWHGWHGRWSTPWIGLLLMLIGFACCMICPLFGSAGTAVLIGGLGITGCGIAITYYGALYYAMSVGNAEVDAGGKHEAMIGMGYTLGPLCGIAGLGLAGPNNDDGFRIWVIILISLAVLITTGFGWVMLARQRRRAPFEAPSPH